jgi:hypothetical protein
MPRVEPSPYDASWTVAIYTQRGTAVLLVCR